MKEYDIIVIGGGLLGCFAAGNCRSTRDPADSAVAEAERIGKEANT